MLAQPSPCFIASQKLSFVSPILLSIGVFGFLSSDQGKRRSLFRAFIGLGLILLALSLISKTAAGLTQLEGFATILGLITAQPVLMLIFGVILSYLAHSSLAIVLLTTGFVVSGFLNTQSAIYLILGANIGSGLLPVIANWNNRLGARIPVTANLIIRGFGVVLAFPFVELLLQNYAHLVPADSVAVFFHLCLNIFVAAAGLILAKPLLALAENLLPEDTISDEIVEPKYLDDESIKVPTRALASAKREALVMADLAQAMVRDSLAVIRDGDEKERNRIVDADDGVDRLFNAIKLYIAQIMQQKLSEEESRRALDILSFTANMEHIGDIVDGSLMELAAKKYSLQIQFSEEGLAEITALHEAVCTNFDLAINTFLSDEYELARELYAAKADVRKIERQSVTTHLERIGSGISDSIDTSGVHLDVVRDLKRINSHLTAIAYPVLKASGEVPKTKWKRKRSQA